ncbi:hypothetical protein [Pseudomonas silesiensis]|uniref:hypothetical protein n=1 Tax=Pseudomonas silesiensis TaxID=1853130 RepID=UPI0012602C22|nr:hypothetical protein [Pseudomonas silesiensis]
MRNSTIENLGRRFDWLNQLIHSNATASKSAILALKNMRTFCALAVPGVFEEIAYNTLKACAQDAGIPRALAPAITDHWLLLKKLRGDAYEQLSPTPISKKIDNSTTVEQENSALLHAHICAIAYIELLRFLNDLINKDPTLSESTSLNIARKIAESSEKFDAISSPFVSTHKNFSVIQGGMP